ncbi:MAG: hypothetical protein J7J92_01995 [Candidatus Aenigmarchaeota archaeon]|nr:hypothetical protein [Candidatus Aenigmarchaeota archaeon]
MNKSSEKSIVVTCPACHTKNKVEVRLLYDGGDHFFECRKCGEPLLEEIEA